MEPYITPHNNFMADPDIQEAIAALHPPTDPAARLAELEAQLQKMACEYGQLKAAAWAVCAAAPESRFDDKNGVDTDYRQALRRLGDMVNFTGWWSL